MRHFNTAGPVRESRHYCVPPLSRVDLDDVLNLVREEKYFGLHAPRQTGKTSTLLALREVLNGGAAGDYRCVYANVEAGQAAREDTGRAMRAILGHLSSQARSTLGDDFQGAVWAGLLDDFGPDGALGEALTRTRTQGQPWLVNALADEACFRQAAGRDRKRPVDADAIVEAQEALIERRETHPWPSSPTSCARIACAASSSRC